MGGPPPWRGSILRGARRTMLDLHAPPDFIPPPARRTAKLARLALPALLGLAAIPRPASAAPVFSAPFLAFDTGLNPRSVAVGDLDRDGRPDLVLASNVSNTVTYLRGRGDGTFLPRSESSTGDGPTSVEVGDLNGDGNPDLAVANAGSGTVSVLLGAGAGSSFSRTDFATGSLPSAVAIGDLN